MAKYNIRLDKGGIQEVLNSAQVKSELKSLGDKVAENCHATAKGKDIPTDAKMYSGTVKGRPRPVVIVAMKHPAASRVEAKRGSLSRAASNAGLSVKRKG